MKYDLVVTVDPGADSILVAGPPGKAPNAQGKKTFLRTHPVVFREFVREAARIVCKPEVEKFALRDVFTAEFNWLLQVPCDRILVGIEGQYLWAKKDEVTKQVQVRLLAFKSVMRNATCWHNAYALLGIDSVEIAIPTWKSHCRIRGRDQKEQALEFARGRFNDDGITLEAADAYCLFAYLSKQVLDENVE